MTLLERVTMAIDRINRVGWCQHWYRLDRDGKESAIPWKQLESFYSQQPACAVGSCCTDAEVILFRRHAIDGPILQVSRDLANTARKAAVVDYTFYDDRLERLNDQEFRKKDDALEFLGKIKTYLEQKCQTSN